MDKFWMVWNEGNRAPFVKHTTYESAKNEAKRLAMFNSGKFFILEATGYAVKPEPVEFHNLPESDTIF